MKVFSYLKLIIRNALHYTFHETIPSYAGLDSVPGMTLISRTFLSITDIFDGTNIGWVKITLTTPNEFIFLIFASKLINFYFPGITDLGASFFSYF